MLLPVPWPGLAWYKSERARAHLGRAALSRRAYVGARPYRSPTLMRKRLASSSRQLIDTAPAAHISRYPVFAIVDSHPPGDLFRGLYLVDHRGRL
jgi:hypothetical protein